MTLSTDFTNVVPFIVPPTKLASECELDWLAAEVRNHSRSSSILAIGKLLTRAKEHLVHGEFARWVDQECGFTIRSAQNYLRAWDLADREGEIVSHLNPAALYRLAARATPKLVVDNVVELLQAGRTPSEAEIVALITNCEPPQRQVESCEDQETDELMQEFASLLCERLGRELATKLVDSDWALLRKHLLQSVK